MTTMTMTSLAESQQALIDARLDTIERMLMGRVPRQDRIAIAREVESQIHELLGDRDPQSITCEDVIDVLRRLDPPEAYLSNEGDDNPHDRARHSGCTPIAPTKIRLPNGREGQIGGIMGICSFMLVLIAPLLSFASSSLRPDLQLLGLIGIALLGIGVGTFGLVLSIRGRRQGILPIFGIVTATLAIPIWLIGPLALIVLTSPTMMTVGTQPGGAYYP